MAPSLREETADQLVHIVRRLGSQASFGRILLEANSRGVLSWHRTLRRYLDLLVLGGVLKVREEDVGSVNPRQTYTFQRGKPSVWSGLGVLSLHGLNWETTGMDIYSVTTDISGLLRSKLNKLDGKSVLTAALEDAVVHELKEDLERKNTGRTELVAALLATKTVDLPYLLRRADERKIGQATRLLIRKLTDTFTSLPGEAEGRTFLQTRNRFLRILRLYSARGHLKLIDRPGKGRVGIKTVRSLSPSQLVSAAGKQLGVQG